MRLKYIDSAKGFAMLLIVWGHTVSFYDPIAHWASAFKISLFYIVTGLLLGLRSDNGIARKTPVKKLLLTSGVPYAFYSALSLCAAAVMMLVRNRGIGFLTEKIILTVTLNGVSTLWFLPSIFFGRLLFERVMQRKIPAVPKIAAAVILPVLLVASAELIPEAGLNEIVQSVLTVALKVLVAFWFIAVGAESGRLMRKREGSKLQSLCTALVMLAFGSVAAFLNEGVDLNNGSFGSRPLLFFLSGVLCSVGSIGVLAFISEKISLRLTTFVGENSLFIMVTHLPLYIVPVVFAVVSGVLTAEGTAYDYMRAIITFALVLVIEWVLILIKNKLTARVKNKSVARFLGYI